MNSNSQPELNDIEIKTIELIEKIKLQIVDMDTRINAKPRADDKSILVWMNKKNVLTALLYPLSGKVIDLDTILKKNPLYKYQWSYVSGWYTSSNSKTESTLNDAKKLFLAETFIPKKINSLTFLSQGTADSLLLTIPDDVMLFMRNGHSSTRDFLNLAKTSRYRYRWFQENQDKIMLKDLLQNAVCGEWSKARKISSRFPGILELKASITCSRGYTYKNLSLLQIAAMNQEDEILREIKDLISPEVFKKQINEIFPNGEIIKYDFKLDTVKELMQELFDAVIKDEIIAEDYDLMNEVTRRALDAFLDYLDPKTFVCQTGLVFDMKVFDEMMTFYSKNHGAFVTDAKRSFWCIRVEEKVASFFSTWWLRAHCQGINPILAKVKKLKDAGFKLYDGTTYLDDPNCIPGVHYHITGSGQAHVISRSGAIHVTILAEFIKEKEESLVKICNLEENRPDNSEENRPNI